MNAVFTPNLITDGKRLVRGEHLLLARTRLRIRDHAHNRPWRVLILPGESCAEEVKAIRSLMPAAKITALDRSQSALEAAIDAGVDDVMECDLNEPHPGSNTQLNIRDNVRKQIKDAGKFDLVVLDLCTNVNPQLRTVLSRVRSDLLNGRGMMILGFSYGRDVVEAFAEAARHVPKDSVLRRIESENVLGRLVWLLNQGYLCAMQSVMLYRGASMPMCSAFFDLDTRYYERGEHGTRALKLFPDLSFVQVEPGDFELAVTCPDPATMYACPQERIETLRRSNAALKAAWTRKLKESE